MAKSTYTEALAEPTKGFFISMLTRDVTLDAAVIDLIDNCVDGARKRFPDGDFSKVEADISISEDSFRVRDNGSGIDLEVAAKRAFRFGRDGDHHLDGSIGRFGVGMKRAFFKIGNVFEVDSHTTSTYFSLRVDVEKWEMLDKWAFPFTTAEEGLSKHEDQTYTDVCVTELHPAVSDAFKSNAFINRLYSDLMSKHQAALDAGMTIMLNGKALLKSSICLMRSSLLQPFMSETIITESAADEEAEPLTLRLYAGVMQETPPQPGAAGWYVYCNGRLILEADQTYRTGWGEKGAMSTPRFHGQYSLFRGYAFLDSRDPTLLPWNTTKTDVDYDSVTYQTARSHMIAAMRPILAALNKLDRERDGDEELAEVLQPGLDSAAPVRVADLQKSDSFTWVGTPVKSRGGRVTTTVSIQYRRPKDLVERLKNALGVGSAKEVGEATFDLFAEDVDADA